MKKRVFSLFLAIVMILSLMPAAFAVDTASTSVSVTLNTNTFTAWGSNAPTIGTNNSRISIAFGSQSNARINTTTTRGAQVTLSNSTAGVSSGFFVAGAKYRIETGVTNASVNYAQMQISMSTATLSAYGTQGLLSTAGSGTQSTLSGEFIYPASGSPVLQYGAYLTSGSTTNSATAYIRSLTITRIVDNVTVTFTADDGVTLSSEESVTFDRYVGFTGTLPTAELSDGYENLTWSVNGDTVEYANLAATINDTAGDSIAVSASASRIMYKISPEEGIVLIDGYIEDETGGSLKYYAAHGARLSFQVDTTGPQYRVTAVYLSAGATYTLTNDVYVIESVESDIRISASFELITFDLTYPESVTIISGTDEFDRAIYGESLIFEVAEPDDGYYPATVKINGVVTEAVDGVYTIANVTNNVTITVEYPEIPYYTVTVITDEYATVSIDDGAQMLKGEVKFTVTTDKNYAATVTVDGDVITAQNGVYSFILEDNATIKVTTELVPVYIVTLEDFPAEAVLEGDTFTVNLVITGGKVIDGASVILSVDSNIFKFIGASADVDAGNAIVFVTSHIGGVLVININSDYAVDTPLTIVLTFKALTGTTEEGAVISIRELMGLGGSDGEKEPGAIGNDGGTVVALPAVTVTFEAGTGVVGFDAKSVTFDNTTSLPEDFELPQLVADAHYKNPHWVTEDGDYISEEVIYELTFTTNKTFTAVAEEIRHLITYDENVIIGSGILDDNNTIWDGQDLIFTVYDYEEYQTIVYVNSQVWEPVDGEYVVEDVREAITIKVVYNAILTVSAGDGVEEFESYPITTEDGMIPADDLAKLAAYEPVNETYENVRFVIDENFYTYAELSAMEFDRPVTITVVADEIWYAITVTGADSDYEFLTDVRDNGDGTFSVRKGEESTDVFFNVTLRDEDWKLTVSYEAADGEIAILEPPYPQDEPGLYLIMSIKGDGTLNITFDPYITLIAGEGIGQYNEGDEIGTVLASELKDNLPELDALPGYGPLYWAILDNDEWTEVEIDFTQPGTYYALADIIWYTFDADEAVEVIDGVTAGKVWGGEDVTFTVAPVDGKIPVVTYTVGDAEADTLTAAENGVYTINAESITAGISVSVEYIADGTVILIGADEYVGLEEADWQILLFKTEDGFQSGYHYTFGGESLLWSDEYKAYVGIIGAAYDKDEAFALISTKAGTAEKITYSGDVDGDGELDAQDSQIIYRFYRLITIPTSGLQRFECDVTGDGIVNLADAQYIAYLMSRGYSALS